MNDNMLGVLGGMGPLASAHFMLRLTLLTPAVNDQDHIPAVLWSDPRIPGRPEAMAGVGPDPLPWLLRGIDGLCQAGCGAIVIPCNTAHGWFTPMQQAAGIPILHIVDAAAHNLSVMGLSTGRIGLMATQATLAMRLYQNRLSHDCIIPDEAQMTDLIAPAIALVKANRVAEAYAPLAKVVNSLASRGAAAVVLGCTEMPLGLLAGPAAGLHVPVVDTIDSLARAAIAWARHTQPTPAPLTLT